MWELKSASERERSLETWTLPKILWCASAVQPLWKIVCHPLLLILSLPEELLTVLDHYKCPQAQVMFLERVQQNPHHPAPRFSLVLVKKFVSTFSSISSYLYFVYDTACLTVLMSWFFKSFSPLFNKLPNEKIINERILRSCATLQALGGCGCSRFILLSGLQTSPSSMVLFACLRPEVCMALQRL